MDEQTTIEDQKQMVDHLHKRVREHMKEKNSLIEMNTELENELLKKEKQMKEVSKYHQNARQEYKEALAIMEKKREVSNKLIKTLQTETSNLKDKLTQLTADKSSEVDELFEELAVIKEINNKKEILLQKISNEKEIMEGKLVEVEKETEDLKARLETKDIEREEVKSLSEELGISNPHSLNVSFKCAPCSDCIEKLCKKEMHKQNLQNVDDLKLKELELERKLHLQRFKLTSDLLELSKNEFDEKNKCKCRGNCKIFHHKHNWTKSLCLEIKNKFKSLVSKHSCKPCDKTFENVDSFKKHDKSAHQKTMDMNLTTLVQPEQNEGVLLMNPSCSSGRR